LLRDLQRLVSSISSNKGQIGRRSLTFRSSFSLPPDETDHAPVALSQAASNWVCGQLTSKPRNPTTSYNRIDAVRLFNAKLTAQMEAFRTVMEQRVEEQLAVAESLRQMIASREQRWQSKIEESVRKVRAEVEAQYSALLAEKEQSARERTLMLMMAKERERYTSLKATADATTLENQRLREQLEQANALAAAATARAETAQAGRIEAMARVAAMMTAGSAAAAAASPAAPAVGVSVVPASALSGNSALHPNSTLSPEEERRRARRMSLRVKAEEGLRGSEVGAAVLAVPAGGAAGVSGISSVGSATSAGPNSGSAAAAAAAVEVTALREQVRTLTSKVASLEATNHEQNEALERFRSNQQAVELLHHEIAALQQDLAASQLSVEKHLLTIEEREVESLELLEQLESYKAKVMELEEELIEKSALAEQYEEELLEALPAIDALNLQLAVELENNAATHNKCIELFVAQIDKLRHEIEAAGSDKAAIEAAEAKIRQLLQQVEVAERRAAEAQANAQRSRSATTDRRPGSLSLSLDDGTGVRRASVAAPSPNSSMSSSNAAAAEQRAQEEEVETLRNELALAREELSTNQSEIELLRAELCRHETEIELLRSAANAQGTQTLAQKQEQQYRAQIQSLMSIIDDLKATSSSSSASSSSPSSGESNSAKGSSSGAASGPKNSSSRSAPPSSAGAAAPSGDEALDKSTDESVSKHDYHKIQRRLKAKEKLAKDLLETKLALSKRIRELESQLLATTAAAVRTVNSSSAGSATPSTFLAAAAAGSSSGSGGSSSNSSSANRKRRSLGLSRSAINQLLSSGPPAPAPSESAPAAPVGIPQSTVPTADEICARIVELDCRHSLHRCSWREISEAVRVLHEKNADTRRYLATKLNW